MKPERPFLKRGRQGRSLGSGEGLPWGYRRGDRGARRGRPRWHARELLKGRGSRRTRGSRCTRGSRNSRVGRRFTSTRRTTWDTEVALICPEGPKRKSRKPRDPRGKPEDDDPGGARRGGQAPRGDVGESPDCPAGPRGKRRSSVWGPSAEHNNLWMRVPDEGSGERRASEREARY